MTFEEVIGGLVDEATDQALALLELVRAGEMSVQEFVELLVVLIEHSRGVATVEANKILLDYLIEQAGEVVEFTPLIPDRDPESNVNAVNTILEDDDGQDMRVARLVRGEITESAHSTYSDTLGTIPHVTGWKRGLESDACQLCRWWSRNGRVWPKDHRMPRHTGCMCHQIPVTRIGGNHE